MRCQKIWSSSRCTTVSTPLEVSYGTVSHLGIGRACYVDGQVHAANSHAVITGVGR